MLRDCANRPLTPAHQTRTAARVVALPRALTTAAGGCAEHFRRAAAASLYGCPRLSAFGTTTRLRAAAYPTVVSPSISGVSRCSRSTAVTLPPAPRRAPFPGRAPRQRRHHLRRYALIPIVGLTGAAVDFSHANSVKADMQSALDSTALMISKNAATMSAAQIQTAADGYFKALFTRPEASQHQGHHELRQQRRLHHDGLGFGRHEHRLHGRARLQAPSP